MTEECGPISRRVMCVSGWGRRAGAGAEQGPGVHTSVVRTQIQSWFSTTAAGRQHPEDRSLETGT